MANLKKRKRILIFGLIGLALAGLITFVIFKKREVPITIQTEKVGRRNLTEIVVANGKIQPVVQVKISPEVSGEIIDLPVKEGQAVKKGQVLLILESMKMQNELKAPRDGIVNRIKVKAGESVEQKQPLLSVQ